MKQVFIAFLSLGLAGAAIAGKSPKVTPELLKKGKEAYTTNCLACHGEKGDGNGPVGAILTPKPRDFATDKFKAGEKPDEVFNTITKGLPGTAMAAFDRLSEENRWALAHYVLLFKKKNSATQKEKPALSSEPKEVAGCIKVSEDKPYVKIGDTFDEGTYNGYRRFNGMCLRCHGEGGAGSSFGPSLVDSLKVMSKQQFIATVMIGRTNTVANSVMPPFANNPDVVKYIDDIYSYMKARSNGDLGQGRPMKNDAKECKGN